MFTPTWGNYPIWRCNMFQMGWFNHHPDVHLEPMEMIGTKTPGDDDGCRIGWIGTCPGKCYRCSLKWWKKIWIKSWTNPWKGATYPFLDDDEGISACWFATRFSKLPSSDGQGNNGEEYGRKELLNPSWWIIVSRESLACSIWGGSISTSTVNVSVDLGSCK